MSLVILKPTRSEPAYEQAAIAFQTMYRAVTGREIDVVEQDDGDHDLVVIGSDAVNDFLMNEVLELRLNSLKIRYGTDDYCIRSYVQNGRKALILAGGRGRSTLYAVYDYFERFDEVRTRFENTPLSGMQPVDIPKPEEILLETAEFVERYADLILIG